MRLTLHDAGREVTNGHSGSEPVQSYEVEGLPPGEKASIAQFNRAWRFLRWSETSHGNWSGEYASVEAALAALQDEINSSTAV
jgi:hypothetical protein